MIHYSLKNKYNRLNSSDFRRLFNKEGFIHDHEIRFLFLTIILIALSIESSDCPYLSLRAI